MVTNQKTIFQKIIAGEIKSYKIYEDQKTIAILDIKPINPGHALVISKKPVDKFNNLPDEDYNALMQTVKKIADKIAAVYNPPRIGVIIEGFEIPHTHVHVFPAYLPTDFNKAPDDRASLSLDQMTNINQRLKIT